MTQPNLLQKVAAAGIVTVGGFTLMMPQAAEAGTVQGTSNVIFTENTLQLLDSTGAVKNPNLFTLFRGTVEAQSNIDGMDPQDAENAVPCASTPISVAAPFANVHGTAEGGAAIDCSTSSATNSNYALLNLTAGPGDNTSGAAIGEYTLFSELFDVEVGDTVDFEANLEAGLTAGIAGFVSGESKNINSNYILSYRLTLDGELVNNAPVIQDAITITNTNTSQERYFNGFDETGAMPVVQFSPTPVGPIAIGDVTGIDYTFENAGEARIEFFAREQVSGSITRTPEPSSLLGLLAVGGLGALLKKGRKKA